MGNKAKPGLDPAEQYADKLVLRLLKALATPKKKKHHRPRP